MKYYSFQLHMRKYLNDMQKDLYPKSRCFFCSLRCETNTNGRSENPSPAVQSFNFLTLFNDMIWNWRRSLPEPLQWDETQGPARNINAARLRGKFYGAQYIIHRPFLHAALDYDLETPDIQSPQNPSVQNNGSSLPPIGPDPQPGSMGPPRGTAEHERYRRSETIKLAVRCIRAAEQSTVAFDGVLAYRRMVVTNIMGTAHAQFGNMLVLSAAYKSKTLGEYVDATKLNHLFHRTINLLGSLAPISRTLEKDCFILQCLRKVVFEGGDVPATSFSSE